MHDNIERRFQTTTTVRAESRSGKRYLAGTAILYGSRSVDLGGWKERIMTGAATKTLASSDLRFLFDHNSANLLGRESSGTLSVTEDKRGVHFRCELPPISIGDTVYQLTKRRDLSGCSFAMRVVKDDWVDEPDDQDDQDPEDYGKRARMIPVRLCREISLIELSCVSFPAYEQTSVSADERAKMFFPAGVPATLATELRSRISALGSSRATRGEAPTQAEIQRKLAAIDCSDLIGADEQLERLRMRVRLMGLDL